MKRILILALALVSVISNAQTLTLKDISISEDSFVQVYNSNIDIDTKFGNASLWVAKSFQDYDRVVQYEDKTNHRLILKSTKASSKVSFALTVDCRDDKYRITAEGITVDGTPYEKYVASIPLRIAAIDEELNNLSLDYDAAKTKWDKAQKKWKPVQYHYQSAKEEFEKVNVRFQSLNNSKQDLLVVDAVVKETIAEVFNSLSSAISYVDEF